MKSQKMNNRALKDLYQAVMELKNVGECAKFFRDLCTLDELNSMTERFAVAKMVQKNIPYRTICKKTGSSTATITRVAHWLHHGTGGYSLIMHRLSRR